MAWQMRYEIAFVLSSISSFHILLLAFIFPSAGNIALMKFLESELVAEATRKQRLPRANPRVSNIDRHNVIFVFYFYMYD